MFRPQNQNSKDVTLTTFLSPTKIFKIENEIHLVRDSPLPNLGLYCTSLTESEEIKKQIQELLQQGVMKPSYSPSGSPVSFVPKKDGGWQMCIELEHLTK